MLKFIQNLPVIKGPQICRYKSTRSNKFWKENRKDLMENHNERPNKDWISKRKPILDAHAHRRLRLATELGPGPIQYKFRQDPIEKEVVIKKSDGKMMPLHEEMPSFDSYSETEIHDMENAAVYYDPLFNPHLSEERNRVDPDEEPFNAIYVGNEQTEGGQQYTGVKNVTSPELWSYVDQLARHRIAPPVSNNKSGEPYPSGFRPPPEEAPDLPYFVSRTRNYQMPVYYYVNKYTIVKLVMGDIWAFEQDLRKHLESLNPSDGKILTFVREPDEVVGFQGRHLIAIVEWLHAQGF